MVLFLHGSVCLILIPVNLRVWILISNALVLLYYFVLIKLIKSVSIIAKVVSLFLKLHNLLIILKYD